LAVGDAFGPTYIFEVLNVNCKVLEYDNFNEHQSTLTEWYEEDYSDINKLPYFKLTYWFDTDEPYPPPSNLYTFSISEVLINGSEISYEFSKLRTGAEGFALLEIQSVAFPHISSDDLEIYVYNPAYYVSP